MPLSTIPNHIRLSNNRWSSKSCRRPGGAQRHTPGRERHGWAVPGWDRSHCLQIGAPSSHGRALAAEILCMAKTFVLGRTRALMNAGGI